MKEYIDKLLQDIKPIETLTNYHVYALWRKGEIVYIGQSTQLYSRIKVHSQTKEFDSFSYFECRSQSEMDLLESKLIIRLEPEYNRDMASGYESLRQFRSRVRAIDDRYKYNPRFYVNNLEKALRKGGFELVCFKGTIALSVACIPEALDYIVGGASD